MTGFLESEVTRIALSNLSGDAIDNIEKHLAYGNGSLCPVSSSHDKMELTQKRSVPSIECPTCGWFTLSVPKEMCTW